MFKHCFVHIGPNKTGTSSIQETLYDNYQTLEKFGFHAPLAERKSYFIASHFMANPMQITGNELSGEPLEYILEFDQTQVNLITKKSEQLEAKNLLLSSEWLCGLTPPELSKLKAYLEDVCEKVTIVAYIRNPIEHAVSLLQQNVWLTGQTLDIKGIKPGQYPEILSRFIETFGHSNIIFRKFEKNSLVEGDVVADYLNLIGLTQNEVSQIKKHNSNEGRSHEALSIASAYNQLFPFRLNGKLNPNRSLIPIIARLPGEKFTIGKEDYEQLINDFRADFEYIKETTQIDFIDTTKKTAGSKPTWGQKTIEALAYAHHQVEKELITTKGNLLLEQAKNSQLKGDLGNTITLLRQALVTDASNFEGLSLLVSILEQLDDLDAAIDVSTSFFKMNAASASHMFLLKRLLINAGRSQDAKELSLKTSEPAPQITLMQ